MKHIKVYTVRILVENKKKMINLRRKMIQWKNIRQFSELMERLENQLWKTVETKGS